MKRIIPFVVLLFIFSQCKKEDDFTIAKDQLGKVTSLTQVHELKEIFAEDSLVSNLGEGDFANAEFDEYLVYGKKGKHLLTLVSKEQHDSTSVIDNIQIFDDRYKTIKGLNLSSKFKDIVGEYSVNKVDDGKDAKTGLPIISLHGKSRKPSQEQLQGLDLVVFDIQDVGVRFYTYIATLQYVMEACAEAGIPVMILDRPNPNGHYIDGPTLEPKHTSFLGLNPIPLVYGMTIGEYAQMINGEKWLKDSLKCDLTVIPLENYTHASSYSLLIRPSPNLPNDTAINLYPSLGFFEGTTINAGRGTEMQFQVYGAPFFPKSDFTYSPKANFGSKYPKHKNKLVNGVDLRDHKRLDAINLKWIIDAYQKTSKTETYFGPTFTIHAGTKKLQEQLEKGMSQDQIKGTWQKDLEAFKKIRDNYLIYK